MDAALVFALTITTLAVCFWLYTESPAGRRWIDSMN